jgi:hypothetical protein
LLLSYGVKVPVPDSMKFLAARYLKQLINTFVGFLYKLISPVFTFLEHSRDLSSTRHYQMNKISHYNIVIYYVS